MNGESLLVKTKDYELNFIKPCITERKKVLAEVKLRRGFKPEVLCDIMSKSKLAKHTKCSEDLGIARIEWEGKTILVFASGEINIRRADDKEDALKTANFIKDILLGK
ncbi:MAG: hypothetical protein KKG13_01660 [Nanoarchaeota archaeon]|nr:hypothetical protein [Nanoarchaeota archaeon]